MNTKTLIILRSVPGSGKSTLSKRLVSDDCIFEADKYFYKNDVYEFNIDELHKAHLWCISEVEKAMSSNDDKYNMIVVSNTNTKVKEMKPYVELADKYGYMVFSLILENRHGGKNVHDVPEETLKMMENRIRCNLKLR
jgi:predicted kinase